MSAVTRRQNGRDRPQPVAPKPARAKITTLSTRSSPSIPASSQAYEPVVKPVLSHRLLTKIFLYSTVFTLGSTGVWRTWGEGGGAWSFFPNLALLRLNLNTVLYASLLWVTGVLPILIVRKRYLRLPSMHASSPLNIVKNAIHNNPNLRAGLLIYISSAFAFAAFHIVLSNTHQSHVQSGLRLFVKSKKHPYYLNGRVIFILTSQTVHAVAFFLRNIMLNRFFVPRATPSQKANPSHIVKTITLLVTVSAFTMFCFCIHILLFVFGRSIQLPIMFKIPGVSLVLRPFAAHFLKGPWSPILLMTHLPLVIRTFFLGLFTVASWEFSETVFDITVAEPIFITPSTPEPFVTLISGINAPDTYFRHFAYSELKELAAEQSPAAIVRRTAFFADQKFNPTLWCHLCREALLLLGRDYQYLLRRGEPFVPAPTPSAATPSSVSIDAPSTPIIRKQIFKTTKESPVRSVLDSLASDGQLTQVADIGASHIPELFRSAESIMSPVRVGAVEARKAEEEVKNWVVALWTKLPRVTEKYIHPGSLQMIERVRDWWSRERLDKVAQGYLWNKETDVLVVDVLSHLTCASLTEDRYGVVQRDIPKMLEAFLSFLSAIEEYRAEVIALDTLAKSSPEDIAKLAPPELKQKERTREEVIKASEVLDTIEDGLKEGVMRIVVTFGDTLSAFKFPPRTARKLQGYVDYSCQ